MAKLILLTVLLHAVLMSAAAASSTWEDQPCEEEEQTTTDETSGYECTCKLTIEYTYRGFRRTQHEKKKWKCLAPGEKPPTTPLAVLFKNQPCMQKGQSFTDEEVGSTCTCQVTPGLPYLGFNGPQYNQATWKCVPTSQEAEITTEKPASKSMYERYLDKTCYQVGSTVREEDIQCTCESVIEYTYRGFQRTGQQEKQKWKCQVIKSDSQPPPTE